MRKSILIGLAVFLFLIPIANAECGITFLTNLYAKRITAGMTTTQSFTLKNTCNNSITLKEYSLTGTVLTTSGEKPVGISELSLGTLPAQGETKIMIDIDTVDVEPGKYSPSLSIVGDNLGTLVTATLGFEIMVVGSVTPPSGVEVSIPSQVTVGKEFTINVSGVESGAIINLFHTYTEINKTSEAQTATVWLWKGVINKAGSYNILIFISSASVLIQKGPYVITAVPEEKPSKYINMVLYPSEPKDGETIILSATDRESNKTVSDCDFFINNVKTSSTTVTAKKSYDIRIECTDRETYTNKITIPSLECQISTTPEGAKEGDKVKIISLDTNSVQLSGTVKIDGSIIADSYDAVEGNHTINFDSEKYTCSIPLNIEKRELLLESSIPSGVETGTKLTFMFNRDAKWKIKNENNVTIISNESNRIDFSADNPGTYTIYAEDKSFGPFSASENFWKANWVFFAIAIVGIIFVLFVTVKLKRRAPKEKAAPKIILTTPREVPPGSEVVAG